MNQATLFNDLDRVPADITMSRHRGSPESIAANPSADSKRADYQIILGHLAVKPMTGKEIAYAMGKEFNCVSGRFKELRDMGKVRKTGIKRKKSAELELAR